MHTWNLSTGAAVKLQKKLAQKVVTGGKPGKINRIAGVDLSYDKKTGLGFCVVLLLTFPALEIVELARFSGEVKFPYVPGLLSFREGPLFLSAFSKLKTKPGLIMFDGQGIAHPRRLGIASHMGVLLGIPTIGCAKSRLCGSYEEPGLEKGSRSLLYDKSGEPMGVVLRTRDKAKPVFVSPGFLVGIEESAEIVMECVTKYRIPEPTRAADIEAAKYKKARGACAL